MRKEEIDNILTQVIQSYPTASDILITVGKPFQVEINGELKEVDLEEPILSLTPFQTEIFALNLLQGNPRAINQLLRTGYCDTAYYVNDLIKFRVNIFSQRGNYSIVLRRIKSQIPTIESLGLPSIFYKIAEEKNGLILVTGPTGSGKSTTLAAIINHINNIKAYNIITLEDPIEFEYTHIKSTINQRELGTDFFKFSDALKAALRQNAKVILLGEIRDRETAEIGLLASETGVLILSTLHTVDAGETINRFVGFFNKSEEKMVRLVLANTLRWSIAQRLVPTKRGNRVAIFEIMASTLRTRELIIKGETEDKFFYDIIEIGKPYGMQTFDQNLIELYRKGIIDEETAKNYASRKNVVIKKIDEFKIEKGIMPGSSNVKIERDYIKGDAPEDILIPAKKKKITLKDFKKERDYTKESLADLMPPKEINKNLYLKEEKEKKSKEEDLNLELELE